MKRLILTGYDDRMAAVGDLTAPRMLAYASRWGADFHCVRQYEIGAHPSWQKLDLLANALGSWGYDEVLWLDADSLITNPSIDIFCRYADIERTVVVSEDWGPRSETDAPFHFSMGNFLMRRQGAAKLLYMARFGTDARWRNEMFWEQSALQYLARNGWADYFHVAPVRALNAVPLELRPAQQQWKPRDYLAHLTSDSNAARVEWIGRWEKGDFQHKC